ncbi:MAG: SDR family NAD(P)-dependent oxidoreductase [Bacteroidetes bacterium]|nr:SDR family NAD(P)-dependent oxidoreductase [Bacteroidota bacterium]
MKKLVYITGASSGFGKAIAEKFAAEGFDIIITGRRKDLLEKLAEKLRKRSKTEVLVQGYDVRRLNEVEKAVSELKGKWRKIDVLVNNAGLAVGLNPIHEGVVDDWERMIDTNVKGLLYVSRNIVPLMVTRKKGHVINIGSVAGKEAYPNGAVYCGSKFAVDAISKGMRIDLVAHGIKVTQVCPGAAVTEFSLVRFKGDRERAEKVYTGFAPLRAEDVAEVVYFAASLPGHVNINDLVLMPTAQASATVIHRK